VKLRQAQTVSIEITDNRGNTYNPIEINAIADQLTYVDVEIKLPLTDDQGSIVYEMKYEYIGEAYAIKYSCGCTDDNYKRIRQWFTVGGINGDKEDEYTHGLMVLGAVECDPFQMICSMINRQDTHLVVARIVQLYAIQNLIGVILNSGSINRFTTLSRELLNAKLKEVQHDLTWRMEWIFDRSYVTDGCWTCKADFEMVKGSLIMTGSTGEYDAGTFLPTTDNIF
jgi:hypothetical protein